MTSAPSAVEITEYARRLYKIARMLADEFKATKAGDSYRFVGSMNLVDDLREVLDEAVDPSDPISVAIYPPEDDFEDTDYNDYCPSDLRGPGRPGR